MDDPNGGTAADRQRSRTTALRALAGGAPGSREEALRVFGDEHKLVLAVHQRWQVTLLARLDQVLEEGTGPPHDDVVAAVTALSESMPGYAALLREHADDPVLAIGRRRLASYVGRACPCGRSHPLVAPAASAGVVERELTMLSAVIRRSVGHCRLRCASRRVPRAAGWSPSSWA